MISSIALSQDLLAFIPFYELMENLILLPVKKIKTPANFSQRSLAYIIDLLVFFFLILMPFSSIYYEVSGARIESLTIEQAMEIPEIFAILIIGYFASILIFSFYLASFEYLIGGTIGKKMIGLEVVGKSKKLGLGQSVIRNLSKTVLFNFLPFDCFLMIFDPYKRRISDFIASTLVVSNRKIIKKFGAVNEL
jgi:uncharacterized RDD family membrane protein YckC